MMLCCASCGIAGVDDIKLKTCTACKSVRYCSVNCQRDHRPHHKQSCKKRAAELRDELLFKQPESSYRGDCPICFLPLELDEEKSTIYTCCSKTICDGCNYSNSIRELQESLEPRCPFCRKLAGGLSTANQNTMRRIAANDPVAMFEFGTARNNKGDYSSAIEYWTKAAELGNFDSHFALAECYRNGQGVEKDKKREYFHLEVAAIGGHAMARHNLGCNEASIGKIEKANKHFIIAANLGYDKSIQSLKLHYQVGVVSKEDFAAALRAHQAAVNATKSPQREAAEEAKQSGRFRLLRRDSSFSG